MKQHIRTFVAIKIQPETKLLAQVRKCQEVLAGERIRWVPPDNYHVTLRFIGNTTREQLYGLVDELELLASSQQPFELAVQGMGYFKRKGKPQLVFAKIKKSNVLEELVNKVEGVVQQQGFHKELKPFRPHLTLARMNEINALDAFYSMITSNEDEYFQTTGVHSFILYQSILRSEGPIYKPIKTFQLP